MKKVPDAKSDKKENSVKKNNRAEFSEGVQMPPINNTLNRKLSIPSPDAFLN